MENKKLIFFDLDGTLLNKNKEVNAETIKAINDLHKAGHYVCIATGRSIDESLIDIANLIKSNTYIIFTNGNFLYDLQADKIICLGKVLLPSVVDFFYQKAKTHARQLILVNTKAEAKRFYFGSQEEYDINDKNYFIHGVNVSNFLDRSGIKFALKEDIVHVSFKAEQKIIQEEYQNFKVLEGFEMASISSVSGVYIDADGLGISKWSAIKEVQKKLHINNENTYAFGDSFNDFEMLKNVGKGYCMGNASEEFKQHHTNIIDDHNTNAIAEIIYRDIL